MAETDAEQYANHAEALRSVAELRSEAAYNSKIAAAADAAAEMFGDLADLLKKHNQKSLAALFDSVEQGLISLDRAD